MSEPFCKGTAVCREGMSGAMKVEHTAKNNAGGWGARPNANHGPKPQSCRNGRNKQNKQDRGRKMRCTKRTDTSRQRLLHDINDFDPVVS
jgi:hypothetical protein